MRHLNVHTHRPDRVPPRGLPFEEPPHPFMLTVLGHAGRLSIVRSPLRSTQRTQRTQGSNWNCCKLVSTEKASVEAITDDITVPTVYSTLSEVPPHRPSRRGAAKRQLGAVVRLWPVRRQLYRAVTQALTGWRKNFTGPVRPVGNRVSRERRERSTGSGAEFPATRRAHRCAGSRTTLRRPRQEEVLRRQSMPGC